MDQRKSAETPSAGLPSGERRGFLTQAAGAGVGLTLVGPLMGLSGAEAQAQQEKIVRAASGINPMMLAYGGSFLAALNKYFSYENMYTNDGMPNTVSGPIADYHAQFKSVGRPYTFGSWAKGIVPASGDWGVAPDGTSLQDKWEKSVAEIPTVAREAFAKALQTNLDQALPKPVLLVVQSSGINSADDKLTDWKGHRVVSADVVDTGGRAYLLLAMLCPRDARLPG